MALLDKVMAAVRITESPNPTKAELMRRQDIKDTIDAALEDLTRVGWTTATIDTDDNRVIEAVKLYVKGRIDFQGKGAAYMENYRLYRNANVLDTEYGAGGEG